jgi:hypothetical protein
MSITLHETTLEGLSALTLESDHLQMQIIPALGCKVISLRHPSTPR